MTGSIAIVGAGLSGNLVAIMLARLGYAVTVYERGPSPEDSPPDGGRSINLALASRGIRALELAGVFDAIEPLLLPMPGRIVHEIDRTVRFLPYANASVNQPVAYRSLHFVNHSLCLYLLA